MAAQEREWLSVKEDYVTCWRQPCVFAAGSQWSTKNPNGIAVAVRMGTKPLISDTQIKTVLTNDFKHYGLLNVSFFFEQNDARSTVVAFHIRGGTEGPYYVTDMRNVVSFLVKRAQNENPVFRP